MGKPIFRQGPPNIPHITSKQPIITCCTLTPKIEPEGAYPKPKTLLIGDPSSLQLNQNSMGSTFIFTTHLSHSHTPFFSIREKRSCINEERIIQGGKATLTLLTHLTHSYCPLPPNASSSSSKNPSHISPFFNANHDDHILSHNCANIGDDILCCKPLEFERRS